MKTRARSCTALVAAALLAASGLAFGGGYIQSPELLDKIKIGVTTPQQVTEILGPPRGIEKFKRREVESWGYVMQDQGQRVDVSIEFDGKGVVTNILRLTRVNP